MHYKFLQYSLHKIKRCLLYTHTKLTPQPCVVSYWPPLDEIQQLIHDTYTAKPRHFVQILGRNAIVVAYVNEKTAGTDITSFLEKLFYSTYEKARFCKNGNRKPLKSFKGYSFCGKAGVCNCAKESVSKNVAFTKAKCTEDENDKITAKRVITTQKIYGVTNNGQTATAKENHAAFYQDEDKVAEVTIKIQTTKLINHNDKNFNNRPKAEATCIKRYGVKSTWQLTADNSNPNLSILRDKSSLSLLFPKFSVEEIADKLSVHVQTVYRYLGIHGFRDPYKSTFEKELIFFLESLGITNILTNKRKIIGKELDIYLPDYKLAIEYNGLYWHHDLVPHITKTYHRDKFVACEKKGIELFSIFGDQWRDKKDIWKEKIRRKLSIFDRKIFSRKTKVVEMTSAETRNILDWHHVQGYCTSSICYGLEYNNEIVAVMTFSKKRASMGKDRGPDAYELVRFVTSCSVPGAASKLLAHFIKQHTPSMIYSYSNNLYSVGNLYKVLGFSLEKEHDAGYWYYAPDKKRSYHRSNYTKYKLIKSGFDPGKSESVIMYERGYLRLWDCGSRTWVLHISNDVDPMENIDYKDVK